MQMPVLGFGVYKSPPEQTFASVSTALKEGYRWGERIAASTGRKAIAHCWFTQPDTSILPSVSRRQNLQLCSVLINAFDLGLDYENEGTQPDDSLADATIPACC